MKKFDITNQTDVECICNHITKLNGELYFDIGMDIEKLLKLETDEPFVYKVGKFEFHSMQQSEIHNIIEFDYNNRLPYKPDDIVCTIVLCKESEYFDLDKSELEILKSKGYVAIHTPSKIIAQVKDIYYTSESDVARSWKYENIISSISGLVNPVSIGKTHIDGIPHLAIGLDKVLIKNRDEDYVSALRECTGHIYVLDEFNKFLLECEGIESIVL